MKQSVKTMFVTDADNTLWDTNKIYADAQLKLLESLEGILKIKGPSERRLDFVREIDQELARLHPSGLKYPAKFLAEAMCYGLRGSSADKAARKAWHQKKKFDREAVSAAVSEFETNLLNGKPELRSGVRTGLELLRPRVDLVIVATERSKEGCLAILEYHNIIKFIDKVIAAPKEPELFSRLARLAPPNSAKIMIGDQIDRDILPAKVQGFVTVFFPGDFTPKWINAKYFQEADFTISSFGEIVDIVKMVQNGLSKA